MDDQAINEFCRITAELHDTRKATLERLGISEEGLRTLHDQAKVLMGDQEQIDTQWGLLQKIPDVPVQWSAHRLKDGQIKEARIFKWKLKLIQKGASK